MAKELQSWDLQTIPCPGQGHSSLQFSGLFSKFHHHQFSGLLLTDL